MMLWEYRHSKNVKYQILQRIELHCVFVQVFTHLLLCWLFRVDVGWIAGSTGQKCERIRLWSCLLNTSENMVNKNVILHIKSQNSPCEAEFCAAVLGGSTTKYVLE